MEEIFSFFTPMYRTLAILAVASFFFIQGKVRADLVALCSLIALMLFDVLNPAEALAGFSNSIVIMMVGLFIVGAGIFRTGLAKMISSKILRLSGNNENLLFVLIMVTTAFVGAFVSNTGTVAVMMPIIISMAAESNISPRRYLMPLAFASSMGLFTLISTPPNLVIQDALIKGGFEELSFFSFAPIGAVALTVGVIVLFFLSKMLVSKDSSSSEKNKKAKTMKELVEEYNLQTHSYKVKVSPESNLVNKSIKDIGINKDYSINISKIIHYQGSSKFRKNTVKEVANSNSVILEDDVLYCYGEEANVNKFIEKYNLSLLSDEESLPKSRDSGIAEVLIMPNSSLINRTVKEIDFREVFNLNILAIQRHNEYHLKDIKDMRLHSGDALLIQGTWADMSILNDNDHSDLVLLGQPLKEAAKVTLDEKAPIAAAIMIFMVLAMVFNLMASVTAVLLAAVFMVVTGCLRNMEEAYTSINWESIVLIGAMLPMSTAFEKTGAASLISNLLVGNAGSLGNLGLLAGVYVCTSLLTMVISNTATAVLFAPIAMQAAKTMGISPYPLLFAVAVAASMCFASPFSTPPNALVMSPGRYTFMDYVKVGLPLQIIMGIVMVFLLPLLFPF